MSPQVQYNNKGQRLYNIGMSMEEINEIILLIDDEPVDEDFLSGIRRKLVNRRKRLLKRGAS